jgi:hypothetical protein
MAQRETFNTTVSIGLVRFRVLAVRQLMHLLTSSAVTLPLTNWAIVQLDQLIGGTGTRILHWRSGYRDWGSKRRVLVRVKRNANFVPRMASKRGGSVLETDPWEWVGASL